MNDLGVYEKTLAADLDPFALLEEAATIGFDFFELAIDESPERRARLSWTSAERDAVRRRAEDVGTDIRVVTLSAHRSTPLGSADPTTRAASSQMLDDAIDLASDLHAQIVQVAGYFVFHEPHHGNARDHFIEGLAAGCTRAHQAGVSLALENVDGEDVVSVGDGLSVIDDIAHPALGLCVDVGNLAANGLQVETELSNALPHLISVDLKDTTPGVYRRVDFGEGDVPFDAVFSLLRSAQFDGPLAVEMWNDHGDTSTPGTTRRWLLDRLEDR